MSATRPPRIPSAVRPREPLVFRLNTLERELARQKDPLKKACIHYEIASLSEHELGEPQAATKHYEKALATVPSFRPAIHALLRNAEGAPTSRQLGKRYERRLEQAFGDAETSDASLDYALWLARTGAPWRDVRPLLQAALQGAPLIDGAGLAIEWLARANNDQDLAARTLQAEIDECADTDARGAMLLALAELRLQTDDYESAKAALDAAATTEAIAWPAARALLDASTVREDWPAAQQSAERLAGLCLLREPSRRDPFAMPIAEERRKPVAAAYLVEAATYCADRSSTKELLGRALLHAPDSAWIQRLQLLFATPGTDDAFSYRNPDDPAWRAFEYRRVASLLDREEPKHALSLARELYGVAPGSTLARKALASALCANDLLSEFAEHLEDWAAGWTGERASNALRDAARLHAQQPGTWAQSRRLYDEAARVATDKTVVLRDAYASAVGLGHAEDACHFGRELLKRDVGAAERSAIRYLEYTLRKDTLHDTEGSKLALVSALRDPACSAWAGDVARVRAATSQDDALLAGAHESIAQRNTGALSSAHWSAAARARLRTGDITRVEHALGLALRDHPSNEYANALLESVLRDTGRASQVLALRERRDAQQVRNGSDERSLLLAAWAALRSDDTETAAAALCKASQANPSSLSPWLARWELSLERRDPVETGKALGGMQSADSGGILSVLRAAWLDLVERDPTRADADLESAESDPRLADMARAGRALLETPGARAVPFDDAGRQPRSTVVEQLLNDQSDAWTALSRCTPPEDRPDLLLHDLRSRILRDGDATEDTFMLAQEAAQDVRLSASAAVALDEVLGPGDDATLRVNALEGRIQHARQVDLGPLQTAYARTLSQAGRHKDACEILLQTAKTRADDPSIWELLRHAANESAQWDLVARACERLSKWTTGSMRAELLEEAGLLRLLELDQEPQGVDLLTLALQIDPHLGQANQALRRLWTEQENLPALIDLSTMRIQHARTDAEREKRRYEKCRLVRSTGDRTASLSEVRKLLEINPHHVGGLALAAELSVSESNWTQAVAHLKTLARLDVPPRQRRIAHLGAADFLVDQLHDHSSALEELREVERLGLQDASLYERMAEIAFESGAWSDALYASDRGAQLSSGQQAAGFAVQAASLRQGKQDDPNGAVDSYLQALRHDPTCHAAAKGVSELLTGAARRRAINTYAKACWKRLEEEGLSAPLLRAAHDAATWMGDDTRAHAALQTHAAVGFGDLHDDTQSPVSDNVASFASADLVHDPARNHELANVLRIVANEVASLQGRTLRGAGVGRKELLRERHAQAYLTDLEPLCAALARRSGDLYVGPADEVIAIADGPDVVHWIVGQRLLTGPPSHKEQFRSARALWALANGVEDLVDTPVEHGASWIRSVLQACDVDVSALVGAQWPSSTRATSELKDAISRRTRVEVGESLGDLSFTTQALTDFARAAKHGADEFASRFAGDLRTSLEAILGQTGVTPEAVYASTRCMTLLRAWNQPFGSRR